MTRSPSTPPTLAALTASFLSRTEDAETLTAGASGLTYDPVANQYV